MSFWRPTLTELANKYGSDKGDKHRGSHQYAAIYERLFAPLKERSIKFLEIGLLHPMDTTGPATRAPSLQMWREYFPKATLIGFDINDFSAVTLPNCRIFQGDMGNRDDLKQLAPEFPFDVILEDASHGSAHQQIALAKLFPYLRPGGMYLIEDLHWQPAELESPEIPKTRDLLRRNQIESPVISADEAGYLRHHIESIELFDSRDIRNPHDNKDGLALIRKRD